MKAGTYIADHLYLLPLIPYIADHRKVYLLTISEQAVNLFDATREDIENNPIEKELPQSLEAVLGEDVVQKSLQFRTSQGESGSGMYHGHGAGNDHERKSEYSKFFREVDQKLCTKLKDQQPPLVLACVDYLFPIYREVSKYPNLYPSSVPGNFDQPDLMLLHKEAKEILAQLEEKDKEHLGKQIRNSIHLKKASYKADEIVPSAVAGKIDTLFIQEGMDLFGKLHPETHQVEIEEEKNVANGSLFNMAALHTIRNSGNVYLETSENMPESNTKINALFRYSSNDH
jgi:hypothetical protein